MIQHVKNHTVALDTSENRSKMTDQVPIPTNETTVAEKLSSFMKNQGDVTFIVGEKEEDIKASSFILSALSPVFEAMFSEKWTETSQIVTLPDVDPKIFHVFLKLIVTEDFKSVNARNLKLSAEEVLHLFYIAKKYDVNSVEKSCRALIKEMKTVENATLIFEALEFLNESNLQLEIFNFIEKNADEFFKTEEFLETSRELLIQLLQSDRLQVAEIDVFRVMCKWAETELTQEGESISGKKIRECLGDLLSLIRFPIITLQGITKIVGPTRILTEREYTRLLELIAIPGHDERQFKLKELGFSDKPRDGCSKITMMPSNANATPRTVSGSLQRDSSRMLDHFPPPTRNKAGGLRRDWGRTMKAFSKILNVQESSTIN